jgi:rRNA-processing protein FCF1
MLRDRRRRGPYADEVAKQLPVISYVDRLLEQLERFERAFVALLDNSAVHYVNPNTPDSGVFFLNAADWGWAPSDGTTTAARMKLLGDFDEWKRRVRLLFAHPTPGVARSLDHLEAFVQRWLERDCNDHSVPSTIEAAKAIASTNFEGFRELIRLRASSGLAVVRLVPDTSALIDNPELASYVRDLSGSDAVIHITPTVLRELDDIKDGARKTQEVRDRARAIQRRLKGLRDKGNLADGVQVTNALTVRFEHREVDPPSMLPWLESTISDDRILAAAIQIQSAHPGDAALLVTSDMNLQNKAIAAGMPYMEPPPDPASLRAKLRPILGWRASKEVGSVPTVVVSNEGPATAAVVSCSATNGTVTVGPFAIGSLSPGDGSEPRDLPLIPEGPVTVTATWTDGDGERSLSWPSELPPRPARPRMTTARFAR